MKILHTADWHIGSFKGPEQDGVNLRSMDTLKCLEEVVRVAENPCIWRRIPSGRDLAEQEPQRGTAGKRYHT